MLFIIIACGAVSGFHSTQSPIMARCLPDEKYGRRIFYGAMIAEGALALIWAAAAMSFFPGGVVGLSEVTNTGGAALVVKDASLGLLGHAGGILAILGVVIGFSLTLIDFSIVWRYFAFSNQALDTIVLWTSAVYLSNNNKFHWIATIPATFMFE